MNIKDVRANLNTINKIVDEHLDFLLEVRQDEEVYKDDVNDIGKMATDVLSVLSKHSDLLHVSSGHKDEWVCEKCGNSTFETDHEYLVHPRLHLGCALDDEIIVDKNDWDGYAEELKNNDTGHQPC